MRRKFFILFIITFFLPVIVTAQSLTNSERRHVNSKVLTVIGEYERYSTLYDSDATYYFEQLFKDINAPVMCDMIGSEHYLKTVTVAEYINQLTAYSMSTTVLIRDVSKGKMQLAGNKVIIPVTFRKNLSYIDKDGYFFSVEEYHSDDFLVNMELSYDRDRDLCLIESIDAKLLSSRKFPTGRFLIVNENKYPDKKYLKYASELTVGGNQLTYNNLGQAILPDGLPEVKDPDVAIMTDTLTRGFNYDVVSYSFSPRSMRLKPRFGVAPVSAYSVQNPCSDNVTAKSFGMEFGLDFGYTWPMGKSSKMGFFFGAGLSTSNLRLSLNSPFEYDYAITVYNSDKNLYEDKTVRYKVESASEKVRYQDLMIPLYFEFEHLLSRQVMLSWNVGVKGYVAMGAQAYSPYSVIAYADGQQVEFASPMKYVEANRYMKDRTFDLSVMGNVGVDVNVYKNRLYCSVHVGYEYGLMSPSYSSDTNRYYSLENGGEIYPIVYNQKEGTHVPVHSLISGISFNRSALWFSAGVKFKL